MSDPNNACDSSEYRYRSGPGIRWKQTQKSCLGMKVLSGFTVDNLNTKALSEAETTFEELFILIRTETELHESLCMDSEEDRLNLCQSLSDKIYKYYRGKID